LPQEGVPPEIEPLGQDDPRAAADGAAAATKRSTPAEPTPANPDAAFNERVAPETPDDRARGFNERIAPEPVPEDEIPSTPADRRHDGPTLLEENADADDEQPSTGDRYPNRDSRYDDRGDEESLDMGDDALHDRESTLSIADSTTDSRLDDRPALAPPARTNEATSRPDPFLADVGTKPLINHAGYRDEDDTAGPSGTTGGSGSLFDRAQTRRADGGQQPQSTGKKSEKPAEKPWAPFTLAMLGLFASMGGNCYLGWLGWGFRERYLRLLDERKFLRGRKSVRQDEDSDVEAVPEDYDG
jgi:hypothetical protein